MLRKQNTERIERNFFILFFLRFSIGMMNYKDNGINEFTMKENVYSLQKLARFRQYSDVPEY
ncbi:MAG: hypothetical protein DWQ44_03895 [Bacteroidetes bacterium]|nr:MAG: hypothetical protein DWQ33_00190 [Bacteroidota bacterium]REK05053.1 MAG: hypothetical protein DWQ39_07535 [Bacteroidota bacterium]REK35557.1 MAG: hypothetical protein DWQ44_03895 [Bacteroidota bacterium]REK51660.1 MAG: hypothetical protein DWQ48_00470 [Bacteroidota bacterium]